MRSFSLSLLFAFSLHASPDFEQLERCSLLYRTGQVAKTYAAEAAKAPPPSNDPQTIRCLSNSSIWYSVDLKALGDNPLKELGQPELWDLLQEMGVDGVELHALGQEIRGPVGECDFAKVADLAGVHGISLIGNPFTAPELGGPDFQLAVRAYKEYPHLFHLIEIERNDWDLLPKVYHGELSSTLPASTVQEMRKLGYLEGRPEKVYPYLPISCWAATPPVAGSDNKLRRWIFLQFPQSGQPALNWLDPTFLSQRLAGSELVDSLMRLQQSVLTFDASPLICSQMGAFSPSANAVETFALLTRKLGGFSALSLDASLAECKKASTDLLFDRFTRKALLHALITQDAEALRLIYRIFLEEGIQPRTMIHQLQPYADAPCEWTEFLRNPARHYRYYEEQITGELLAQRLLKEDLYNLKKTPSIYSVPVAPLFGLCADALSLSDLEKDQCELLNAHLLLAFFYAMQPGVFSFSALDLRGCDGADPMKGPGLYHPLPRQLKTRCTFASRLQQILSVRKDQNLQLAELIDVLPTRQKGLILLLHRLPLTRQLSLTAVNFSRSALCETISGTFLTNKWAINLMNQQSEGKLYGADNFQLQINGLSGKVFLFQPKPYSQ